MPRPSLPAGMAVVISATLLACSMAAPTPCTTRHTTSTGRLGAKAHAADASVNTANP
jgi:hypothetical protein